MSLITKAGVVAFGTGAVVLSGAGMAVAHCGADAEAATVRSGGIASGNVVQIPIHAPINVCNNTIRGLGLLNPSIGNVCKNGHHKHHDDYGN